MPKNTETAATTEATKESSLRPDAIIGQELPAIFVNNFYVVVTDTTTRITLREYIGYGSEELQPRAAFIMPTTYALDLAKLILKLHEQHTSRSSSGASENG